MRVSRKIVAGICLSGLYVTTYLVLDQLGFKMIFGLSVLPYLSVLFVVVAFFSIWLVRD